MSGWDSLLPEALGMLPALLLIIASFFTSALTAVFGVGGGLAMLALLGLFVPVAALIPVHGAVQLGSNTGRAWHQRAHIRFSITMPFIIGSLIGAAVGAYFVVQLPDALLKLVLGLFVLTVTWAKIPGVARLSHAGLAAGSAVIALATMFVGATGPLLSAFFAQIIPDDRKALIATHAAGMTVQHALKVIAFALAGFAFWRWLPFVAVMVASGYLGTIYGSRLLEKMPEAIFRRWFKIGLTLLALDLVRRGLAGMIW
ncbi:sulfite exporter TauE/SafE family protein [Nitratireductor soli]|uniref:sulfite exporter TauE/SafE family protein n=1 Tax=Nitratireductor soli TaxID=1670619 RepID=UPI0009E48FBE|nr:sulfite exporter TauE/SafE family protein [Nitratireductor soli]